MAVHHRGKVDIENRENLISKTTKGQLPRVGTKHAVLTRRPALDELSNKLHDARPPAKTEVKKPTQPDVKKKTEPEEQVASSYSSEHLGLLTKEDLACQDSQMLTEYLGDIYTYLQELELKYAVKEDFLKSHKSTPKMRGVLVNWLVQVQQSFSLYLETLHMCVSIIDRYLEIETAVGHKNLQLVGTAALFVACKYEEMYCPDLADFEYICDNSFTKTEILGMESSILMTLQFNLGKPLSIHFLRRYSKIAKVQSHHHQLSKYLLELALLDYEMCHIKPSIQAAAACCLSLSIFRNECPSKIWTSELIRCTTYKYADFRKTLGRLASLLLTADSSKNKSVYLKYAEAKFGKISTNPKLKGHMVKSIVDHIAKA